MTNRKLYKEKAIELGLIDGNETVESIPKIFYDGFSKSDYLRDHFDICGSAEAAVRTIYIAKTTGISDEEVVKMAKEAYPDVDYVTGLTEGVAEDIVGVYSAAVLVADTAKEAECLVRRFVFEKVNMEKELISSMKKIRMASTVMMLNADLDVDSPSIGLAFSKYVRLFNEAVEASGFKDDEVLNAASHVVSKVVEIDESLKNVSALDKIILLRISILSFINLYGISDKYIDALTTGDTKIILGTQDSLDLETNVPDQGKESYNEIATDPEDFKEIFSDSSLNFLKGLNVEVDYSKPEDEEGEERE